MRKRGKFRPDNRRIEIANEAARLIQEHGLTDFKVAKEKAVERLGLQLRGALPGNSEIAQALAERNRIFKGEKHQEYLLALRIAALDIMSSLAAHQPLLVGPVLSGHATEHSIIELHLFGDTPEEIGFSLDRLTIRFRNVQHRQRLSRDQIEYFPGYRFFCKEFEFTGTVFPNRRRHHAPLSPVDGRPMERAAHRDILLLVESTRLVTDADQTSAC